MRPCAYRLRSIVLISSAFLFLGVNGCIESKHPLSNPDKATLDPELLGEWLWHPTSDSTQEWVVAKAGPGFPEGMLTLRELGSDMKEGCYLFTTTIGKDRYINVANFLAGDMPDRWDAKQVVSYTLLPYQVSRGVFESTLLDQKFFKKAVERRELAGEGVFMDGDEIVFIPDAAIVEFSLTAPVNQLRQFFMKHGKAMSGDEVITATRKPTPEPQSAETPKKARDEVKKPTPGKNG